MKTFTWPSFVLLYSVKTMPFREQKLANHKWIIIDSMGNGFMRKNSHCWSPLFPSAYKRFKTLIFLLQASKDTGFSSTTQTTHHLPQVVSEMRVCCFVVVLGFVLFCFALRANFWHCPQNVLKNTLFKNVNRIPLNCSAQKCILNGRNR